MSNTYQLDTVIQLIGTFYNVALNMPADPVTVTLFIEGPLGNVTTISTGIVRTGIGAYYYDFLPTGPGCWKYKWQGSGTTVQATSKDTRFFVQGSDFESELV